MLRLASVLLTCLTLSIAASASGMRAPAVEQGTAIHSALISSSIETCVAVETGMPSGDQVLAFNEWKPKSTPTTDTRLSYEKVVDIYTSYKQQTLVHLTLDNGQRLTATEGHPFKTTDGWRDAVLLKKGGQLLLKGGEDGAEAVATDLQPNKPLAQGNNAQTATKSVASSAINNSQAASAAQPGERVITIADIRLEVTTVAVYNLEVANAHTFFVGADGVLVHNGFGSYTCHFKSGKKYHGKGDWERAMESAKEKAGKYGDLLDFIDWTSAANDHDSFKDEHNRMESDRAGNKPGHKSDKNYNRRASPGRRL